MQGEQVKLYSNRQLRDLLIPLLIEQTLVMLVGMADTVMVSSLGEAAVSGVSLVDQLCNVLLALFAGSQAESFVRYFVIVIFAGIVWPLTFPFFANIGKKGKAA